MSKYYDWAFKVLLHLEAGYVNDPDDPGGATNFGISLRYLKERGDLDGDGLLDGDLDGDGIVDITDIQNMTQEDAEHLYLHGFWLPNKLDRLLSELVAVKMLDMCVNMGSKQAWKLAQRAANRMGNDLIVDGIVGPKTIDAINLLHRRDYELLTVLREEQGSFYSRLIVKKPVFEKYRVGWLRRAAT